MMLVLVILAFLGGFSPARASLPDLGGSGPALDPASLVEVRGQDNRVLRAFRESGSCLSWHWLPLAYASVSAQQSIEREITRDPATGKLYEAFASEYTFAATEEQAGASALAELAQAIAELMQRRIDQKDPAYLRCAVHVPSPTASPGPEASPSPTPSASPMPEPPRERLVAPASESIRLFHLVPGDLELVPQGALSTGSGWGASAARVESADVATNNSLLNFRLLVDASQTAAEPSLSSSIQAAEQESWLTAVARQAVDLSAIRAGIEVSGDALADWSKRLSASVCRAWPSAGPGLQPSEAAVALALLGLPGAAPVDCQPALPPLSELKVAYFGLGRTAELPLAPVCWDRDCRHYVDVAFRSKLEADLLSAWLRERFASESPVAGAVRLVPRTQGATPPDKASIDWNLAVQALSFRIPIRLGRMSADSFSLEELSSPMVQCARAHRAQSRADHPAIAALDLLMPVWDGCFSHR